MGVGVSIAARWVPVIERGSFSPIPFFYVMGGSLVFLFLTWHIPSVASAMMAGAVHLSIADVYYPAMLAGRAGAMALGTAGALFTLGRWSTSRVREWSALHTIGGGGADGAAGSGTSPLRPNGGGPPGAFTGPLGDASIIRATEGPRVANGGTAALAGISAARPADAAESRSSVRSERRTPPNT